MCAWGCGAGRKDPAYDSACRACAACVVTLSSTQRDIVAAGYAVIENTLSLSDLGDGRVSRGPCSGNDDADVPGERKIGTHGHCRVSQYTCRLVEYSTVNRMIGDRNRNGSRPHPPLAC